MTGGSITATGVLGGAVGTLVNAVAEETYVHKTSLIPTAFEPVFQVLNLANDFDKFCSEKGKEHREALDDYYEFRDEHFPDDLLNNLITMLN